MNAITSDRADLRSLVTHRFKLDQIEEAYDLFANQRDGVQDCDHTVSPPLRRLAPPGAGACILR
jgi:hypothetical protein